MIPLISIITVSKNSRALLEETILSVANQSYHNFEYIIIDGGSVDGTSELVKKNLVHINKFISEEDDGIYDAMNKGIKNARGDWIYFLNAGDKLNTKDVIKKISETIIENNKLDIIYGDYELVQNNKKSRIIIQTPELINKKFLLRSTVCQQAVFFNKSIFKRYGSFRVKFTIVADYDRLLHAFMVGCRFKKVNIIICEYLEGGYSRKHYLISNLQRLSVIKLRCTVPSPLLYLEHAIYIVKAFIIENKFFKN